MKLSTKSSSAAKLFNAVHKAQVSWNRIRPLFDSVNEEEDGKEWGPGDLEVKDVSFAYPDGKRVLEHVSFSAKPGQIIGVTGPVACGKSTLGKLFLCECPYEGTVRFAGKDLLQMEEAERKGIVAYLGHDPELFHDSVRDNVLLGDEKDLKTYLKAVCIDREVSDMEEGEDTLIGNGGVRLSGGQAQRVALARTLCHKKPLLVLDDPFSALDKSTEKEVFANVRAMTRDSIVLLLSHRLYLFPQMDQIIWMDEGKTTVGTHEELLQKVSGHMRHYLPHRKERTVMKHKGNVRNILIDTVNKQKWLSSGILITVLGAIGASLISPLLLGKIVDSITAGHAVAFSFFVLYFVVLALTGFMDTARESLLTVFGQKITHALRSRLMEKFVSLSADTINQQESGTMVSRFIGDVDTVENLFTSGIISMFADTCKILSILAVIWFRNKGLTLVLLFLLPFLFWFTRHVQKNMLTAQIENRRAVGRASGHVPETIHNIRTTLLWKRKIYGREVWQIYQRQLSGDGTNELL